jgi:hypothetical protein
LTDSGIVNPQFSLAIENALSAKDGETDDLLGAGCISKT